MSYRDRVKRLQSTSGADHSYVRAVKAIVLSLNGMSLREVLTGIAGRASPRGVGRISWMEDTTYTENVCKDVGSEKSWLKDLEAVARTSTGRIRKLRCIVTGIMLQARACTCVANLRGYVTNYWLYVLSHLHGSVE